MSKPKYELLTKGTLVEPGDEFYDANIHEWVMVDTNELHIDGIDLEVIEGIPCRRIKQNSISKWIKSLKENKKKKGAISGTFGETKY